MRRTITFSAALLVAVFGFFFAPISDRDADTTVERSREAAERPNDWFGRQRAFPNGTIPMDRFNDAINDVIIDPFRTETLYVGTDVGVFRSNDLGAHWTTFGNGMPINVVTDLDYHPPTRMLVAETYGRSIFKTTTEPARRRAPRPVRAGDS